MRRANIRWEVRARETPVSDLRRGVYFRLFHQTKSVFFFPSARFIGNLFHNIRKIILFVYSFQLLHFTPWTVVGRLFFCLFLWLFNLTRWRYTLLQKWKTFNLKSPSRFTLIASHLHFNEIDIDRSCDGRWANVCTITVENTILILNCV